MSLHWFPQNDHGDEDLKETLQQLLSQPPGFDDGGTTAVG